MENKNSNAKAATLSSSQADMEIIKVMSILNKSVEKILNL